MKLKIISTSQVLFDGEAVSVTLPGAMGAFTVLHNHASLISVLVKGNITCRNANGDENTFAVSGGIADVDNNVISVCVF